MTDPIEVFLSYSHKDEALRDRLVVSLKGLERQRIFRAWHDRKIDAGDEWQQQIDQHLESSRLILLLISPDFLASNYCFDIEMTRALERHEDRSAVVIPIILRPCDWPHSPFSKLAVLPRDGKPITTYANRDLALEEVVAGIRAGIDRLRNLSETTVKSMGPARALVGAAPLLQVAHDSPLVVGFGIDVSGSMQKAIGALDGGQVSRLQSVFDVLKRLAGAEGRIGVTTNEHLISLPNAVKIFAYGFGFVNRAADFGSFAGLARQFLSIPPLPARIGRGNVRDLFELAGITSRSMTLDELGKSWTELEAGLWEQRIDLFGETPMVEVMKLIQKRFEEETEGRAFRRVLFLISDGDSTDGSPIEICQAMASDGITIVSLYLTDVDVTEPRKLFREYEPSWPQGAKTLFSCSSIVGEEMQALNMMVAEAASVPTERRWQMISGSHLFLQLNHSELLSEFITAILGFETKTVG